MTATHESAMPVGKRRNADDEVHVPVLSLPMRADVPVSLADVPVNELRFTDEGREALAAGEIGWQRLFVMAGDHIPFTMGDLAAVLDAIGAEGAAGTAQFSPRRALARCRALTEDAVYSAGCAVDRWVSGR